MNNNFTENFQAYADALLERINQPNLFSSHNGMSVTEITPDYVLGELAVSPTSMNPRGIVHGGCLSSLMDTVAGISACTSGFSCVTLNCTMSYMRPVSDSKKVYCKATPVKMGRTICVISCELTDDNGTLVTTGTYTFYLKEPLYDFLNSSV